MLKFSEFILLEKVQIGVTLDIPIPNTNITVLGLAVRKKISDVDQLVVKDGSDILQISFDNLAYKSNIFKNKTFYNFDELTSKEQQDFYEIVKTEIAKIDKPKQKLAISYDVAKKLVSGYLLYYSDGVVKSVNTEEELEWRNDFKTAQDFVNAYEELLTNTKVDDKLLSKLSMVARKEGVDVAIKRLKRYVDII